MTETTVRSLPIPEEDAWIESLGSYFVHHNILERFGIDFSTFHKMWERGDWEEFIK